MDLKFIKGWLLLLASVFFLVVSISGCCVKKKYKEYGVKYQLKDWPDYTQDKELWGNRGYFYPVYEKVEIEKPKKVVKREVSTTKPKTEEAVTKPAVKKKVKGEKEWCPKKKRTVIPEESKLMVADFDTGSKPNNMGYDFGAWDKDPQDFTQTCIDSFTPLIKKGDSGYSLQLYYDVDSPVTAYNGFWCKLDGDIDYSVFKKVGFWVKGDGDRGYTSIVKVELKNCINETAIYYVTGITDKWQQIIIPFKKFSGLTEWSLLKEFVITFEDRVATKKEGTIYIDEIYFEK